MVEDKKGAYSNSMDARKARLSNNLGSQGKIPPQAPDLEEKVLASIVDDDMFIDVSDILKPEHFYRLEHQKILEAVIRLFDRNDPVDMATVCNELRVMGMLETVGGMYYIANLVKQGLKSGTNIEYHSKIIFQKYVQRELIRNCQQTESDAYDDSSDVFELIERNQTNIAGLVSESHKKEIKDISDLLKQSFQELQVKPKDDGLTGVGTSFTKLDEITGGWQKQDLIIIAARPAMGKTAFVLNCARNAAVDHGKKGVIFSLEMSSLSLANRLVSPETSVPIERILKKRVERDEMIKMWEKVESLKSSGLMIDDTAGLNIFEFRAKARRLKQQHDIQWIIVDYLQLMYAGGDPGKFTNRVAEIGKISRALKSVAKELDIPVIALSQLSRAVESRPGLNGKRPNLSDLRESGDIEQDADMVIFLYRPEYYGIVQDPQGNSTIGLCEAIIAKHRNGVTDNVPLDFNGAFMRFKDWVPNSSSATISKTSEIYKAPELEFGVDSGIPKDANKYSDDDAAPF